MSHSVFPHTSLKDLHEVKILQIHNAMSEFVKKYHGY
jgi:hypothetical protein